MEVDDIQAASGSGSVQKTDYNKETSDAAHT